MSPNGLNGAGCAKRPDLPWTSDFSPGEVARRQMSAVCEDCPVILQCALFALGGGHGGFYAGVWLPWDGTTSTKLRDDRHRARNALRHRARTFTS